MAIAIPDKLNLAQLPSPLTPLNNFSKAVGGPRIWLKRDDLTGIGASGNKIRKLEFTLHKALKEKCTAIVTCGGIQSNHCRATALLCARLNLDCHLILRGDEPTSKSGNLLLDVLCDSTITYVKKSEYQKSLNDNLKKEKQAIDDSGGKAWIIPTGASDGYGVWGYINCVNELKAQFSEMNITPGHIVHATGSGGTQAGLTLGFHLVDSKVSVWGVNVCDNAAYFHQKVRDDIRDWQIKYKGYIKEFVMSELMTEAEINKLNVNVIEGYMGEGYAIPNDDVLDVIASLARSEGIFLDPVYTGKAFYGLVEEIKKGRFKDSNDVVFIHTGGIFGLFAYEDELNRFLVK